MVLNRASRDDSVAAATSGLARAFAAAERGGVHAAIFNGTAIAVRLETPGRLVMTDESTVELPASPGRSEATSRRRTFTRLAVEDLGNSLERGGPHLRGRAAWVLSEDRVSSDADAGVRKIHQEQVATYTNVRWFRNPARDAQRRAARPTREWVPLGGTPQGHSGVVPNRAGPGGAGASYGVAPQLPAGARPVEPRSRVVACDDQCGGGAYYSAPPGPIGDYVPCAEEVQAHPVTSGGVVNFVYQHGFVSNAKTWCDGSNYLRTRFRVGTEVRHSLNSLDLYQNQAADLQGRLQADQQAGFGGPYVFVGHSNGGVISRYTAQNVGGNPGLVRGVVTVSSPLAGAPLASVTDRALTGFLTINAAALFSCRFVSTFVCTRAALLTSASTGVVAVLHNVLRNSAPITTQMTPNNGFHAYMNSRGDPFPHAAVVNVAWDKWTLWRILGDSNEPPRLSWRLG